MTPAEIKIRTHQNLREIEVLERSKRAIDLKIAALTKQNEALADYAKVDTDLLGAHESLESFKNLSLEGACMKVFEKTDNSFIRADLLGDHLREHGYETKSKSFPNLLNAALATRSVLWERETQKSGAKKINAYRLKDEVFGRLKEGATLDELRSEFQPKTEAEDEPLIETFSTGN